MMLDCGLNMQSILHFMPLPMVPSSKFNSLPTWLPRDNQQDWQVEGVSIQSEETIWCLRYTFGKLTFQITLNSNSKNQNNLKNNFNLLISILRN